MMSSYLLYRAPPTPTPLVLTLYQAAVAIGILLNVLSAWFAFWAQVTDPGIVDTTDSRTQCWDDETYMEYLSFSEEEYEEF